MTAYSVVGRTARRDSGNGARGTGTPGHSTLAVVDATGRIVASYERTEARWGGASTLAWFLTDEGRRQAFHQVPNGGDAATLRQWFKREATRRYGVSFGR